MCIRKIEIRKYSILPVGEYLMPETIQSWKGLATIIRMASTREVKGKTSSKTRYCISDEKDLKASYYQSLIRGNWSIENQLLWHLDITFKEDDCRVRKGYLSQNLSVLRKMTLHIMSKQKDKLSMKRKLYKATLDIEYLKKILEF